MIRKSQLFNALFILGFPVFGFGTYYGLKGSISQGMIVSVAPFAAIVLIHLLDAAYRRDVRRALTTTGWLGMAYIGTLVLSQFVALRGGIPGVLMGNVLISCLLYLMPFAAAIVVCIHGRQNEDFDFGNVLFLGLSALLAINVLGYFGGVRAIGHAFEGGANLPFLRGIYTGAHLWSVWALMLLVRMRGAAQRPVATALALAALAIGFYLMLKINSRLSTLIFLLLAALFVTKAIKVARGLYTISLFTLPLLLSFSLLVYQVVSMPFFAAILGRVSKEDVTSFNGRSYIWEAIGNWLATDRTGLLFGNGYKGHYALRLYDPVAVLWGTDHSYNIHSHSTFAEVLVSQGIIGVVLLYVLFWKGFKHYRSEYLIGAAQAPVFAGLCYLLFIWQIDIFCYGTDLGHVILFSMLAPLCVRGPAGQGNLLK